MTHQRHIKFLLVLMTVWVVVPASEGAPAGRGVRLMPVSIPMPDGVSLAATLYMPADLHPHERRVEWRDQAVRWFDHWLKGIDNGVDREPRLLVYQQHSHPPGAGPQDIPEEWRADQRPVDAYSLTYDSAPLEAEVAMLGFPHVRLRAAADAPLADWFVRLEDVADDGRVTAITGAGLAGAQRRSMEHPGALTPGSEYALDLDLHLSSWVWPRGHRIRVAISNAQWPMHWPTPYPMTTALRLGGAAGSAITLPIVPVRGRAPGPFGPLEEVESPAGITTPGDYAWPGSWKLERDEANERSTVTWHGTSAVRFPWGSFEHSEQLVYHVDDADPAHSAVEGKAESVETLAGRVLTYRGHLTVTSDAATFHYAYTRELLCNGTVVRTKTWQEEIPRDLQ